MPFKGRLGVEISLESDAQITPDLGEGYVRKAVKLSKCTKSSMTKLIPCSRSYLVLEQVKRSLWPEGTNCP